MPDMPLIDIRPDHWRIVRDILQKHVPHDEVWAFGSRTKWTAKEYSDSDLDLAIITEKPLSLKTITNLSEDLSESDLPWRVDIVDWSTTSASFQKVIERDKMVVQTADRINDSANRNYGEVAQGDKGCVIGSRTTEVMKGGSSNWPLKKLSDVADVIGGGTPSTKNESYYGGGVSWITPKDLSSHKERYISKGERSITTLGLEKSSARLLPTGAVLFTSRAPIGYVAIAENELATNQGFKSLLLKPGNDPEFFYYLLKANTSVFESRSSGSTFKEVSGSVVKNTEFRIPPEDIQKEISRILSSLDKKIELNTQTNQTLEQIAQALFKSWFVDFDPVKAKIEVLAAGGSAEDAELAAMRIIAAKSPDELTELKQTKPEAFEKLAQTAALFPSAMQESELGEIPEGWEAPLVKDVADTIKGKSYKSSELDSSSTALVTLKSFKRGGGYRLDGLKEYTGKYKTEQEVFAGDLIVAYTDVTQAADVIGKPAMVISDSRYKHLVISLDVAVIRPSNDNLKYYLYGIAKTELFQQHTQAHSTGTTVLHLSKNAVPEYSFVLASDNLINAYAKHVQPIFSKINKSIEENNNLAAHREVLLPKLLSGEIDLTNEVRE